MLLAIDAGNSHIVLGAIEDGEIRGVIRIHTDIQATAAEYAARLDRLLRFYHLGPEGFEGAILSCVVPPLTGVLTVAVREITGLNCMVVGPGVKTGLNLRIDDPASLAGDLVVGSVAAAACYGTPVIVLDMGTANTLTVVDRDGAYRGGAIMPGVDLAYSALASGTSLLPDISIAAPKRVIGSNTVDAMRSGAVFGTAAAIDGMLERMERELGYPCRVVATGALAQAVSARCRHEILYDGDLLLKGLWLIYNRNRR